MTGFQKKRINDECYNNQILKKSTKIEDWKWRKATLSDEIKLKY